MSLVRVGSSLIAGQGLFAAVEIPKDTHIIEYTGEKISTRESLRRLAQGNVYIFRLNYRWAIDGKVLENLARYINYSFEPNCTADTRTGQIWMIAVRDIRAGEERTSDDGYDQEKLSSIPVPVGRSRVVGLSWLGSIGG